MNQITKYANTPRRSLSSRPRLLPGLTLLSRAPDVAQLGHALCVTGSKRIYELLRGLDGRHSYTELLQSTTEPELLRELVTDLDESGLLEDTGSRPPPGRLDGDLAARALEGARPRAVLEARARAAVVIHGDGRIGIATALALAAAGVGHVHLAASGTVRAQDCGTGYRETDVGRPRSTVAPELLRTVSSTARFDRLSPKRAPDLVLFTDTPAARPEIATALHSAGIPALLAYPRDGTGVIGPLIVPGQTGCVRCIDLWRTGNDPGWPRIATQLADLPQPSPLAVAHLTSAITSAQALRFLDGDPLGQLRDAAVDVEPDTLNLRWRTWPPNPACTCERQAGQEPAPSSESHPARQATRERG
ncbi:TOMM precursor leader peptide-binding protein [Sciscionella marina]|uniref:TOMM precursor leader peptide-binding protein n=1 Tax=Sciscionella marina TaxID=508770 RepID=UPI000375B387|nr:TOMM precursor leader peptide-binding protein [Sciscionella marina]